MAGSAAALTVTAAIARIAGGTLFDVDPTGKAACLAVAGLLAMVSLAASYGPARHASRADPLVVLRQEYVRFRQAQFEPGTRSAGSAAGKVNRAIASINWVG